MDYAPKKSPVYRCGYTRNDETELCYKQEISESLLNKALFDIISKQAEIILNIDNASNIYNASNIDNAQIKTEQLADMEKQIAACQKEKQILYEQLLTGKITLEEYKKLKQETDTKVENYRVQYNKYRQSAEQTRLENDEKLKNLQIAKTAKKENTLTQALADMLIDKVYVYPDNRLEIEWIIKDFCTDTTVMLS